MFATEAGYLFNFDFSQGNATILGVRMDDMCKFPFSVPNILK